MKADPITSVMTAATRSNFELFSDRVFYTLNINKPYQPNWHNTVMAYALMRCLKGEIKRLVILLPPRHLKSTIVSVAFPAFILGHNPSAKIICASYNTQLATDLSNQTRKILNEHWYTQTFPSTQIGETDKQDFFKTTANGYRFATTPGGAMTGMGANFIILDDPQKAADMIHDSARNDTKAWLDNTVYTRLDDPVSGVIIIVMQRLHEDDLIGHVLQGNGWEVIKIPVRAEEDLKYQLSENYWHTFKKGTFLQPERFGQQQFDSQRNSMGTSNFYAQYQQSPVPPAGNLFDWKWFNPVVELPECSEIILSVDVASSKDAGNFSAFTVWGHLNSHWYLMAAYRYQYEIPEVRKKLMEIDKRYRPDLIVIDGVGVGRGLAQELRAEGMSQIKTTNGRGKRLEAAEIAPMVEGGRVNYVNDAPGLIAFRDEVIAFPRGKYDDQVDSMVQVLIRCSRVLQAAQWYKRPERKHIKSSFGQNKIKVTNISGP